MTIKAQNKTLILVRWVTFLIALVSAGYIILAKEDKPQTSQWVIVLDEDEDSKIIDINDNDHTNIIDPFAIRYETSKVAIIISDMGLNESLTDLISKSVDENVSLSLSPYSRNLDNMIGNLQNLGKESYISLVISSDNFSQEDFGPKALELKADMEKDITILNDIFDTHNKATGVVIDGYIANGKADGMKEVLQLISDKNLLLVDATDNDVVNNINIDNLSRIRADIIIGEDMSKENLQNFLVTAQVIAKDKGQVVIVTSPKPLNILLLIEWVKSFKNDENAEKPLVLVPTSTLIVK